MDDESARHARRRFTYAISQRKHSDERVYRYANRHCAADANRDADRDAHIVANANRDANRDAHANSDAHLNADANYFDYSDNNARAVKSS